MRGSLAGLLLLYSAATLPATGFVMQEISYCGFGDDRRGNATFQYFMTFNRQPILEYDSSANMFIPYQSIRQMKEVVANYTTQFNRSPDMANYVKSEMKRCKEQKETFWDRTVERRLKPSMAVYAPEPFSGESLPVLVCHVWGFYPADIVVAWIRNEETVVRNESQAVRVGDWTYQVVSRLDLRDSGPDDNYTCIIKHQSLDEPMMKTWKPGLTSTQITKISVSAVIFALGVITLLIGVFCWKNAKRSGYTPIPGYNDIN